MLHVISSSLHHEELPLPFELPQKLAEQHQVVAVMTGGTEGLFLELVQQGDINLESPIYLMVSQQSNSLAAAMEILSWINLHQGRGEILTAAPVGGMDTASESEVKDRIGIIGAPSDWLISSDFDAQTLRDRLGIEIIEVPITEVTSLGQVEPGLEGANRIYMRIKEIISRYRLAAVTLRCFDLLTTVCNTGCMALSRLNDEGIPSSCEGDVPTLITMILCKRLTGCPGFQANPARIDPVTGKMLFAHCTIPLTMTQRHSLTTHFESGIGVAIHGELPLGDYTLVKVSGDLQRIYAQDATLYANQYEQNLCRTQVWLQVPPQAAQRLLKAPIANHHVIIPGHWADRFLAFINGN